MTELFFWAAEEELRDTTLRPDVRNSRKPWDKALLRALIMLTILGFVSGCSNNTPTPVSTGTLTANAGGPYSATIGQTITFDGSKSTAPTGQTLSYAWTFGDSTAGTGISPTHAYTAAGTYTVSLTITGSGTSTTSVATATAVITAPPVANAGGPYTGSAGQTLTFDGSKSTATAGQTLTYAWNFGDSTSGTGIAPTHAYTTAGTFTVTVTVTASGGGTATATATATIAALPVANAGGPYTSNAGQAITFDGSKSTVPAGQTLTYAWNFGDSGTATGISPIHTYTTAGSYTVTLTVTGSSGGTATATATATVAALPVANAGGPYSGTVAQTITFDGSKSTTPAGQTLTYVWTFGDTTSGAGLSPTHAYTTAGTYTVTLTVTGTSGGTATAMATATVTALPVANAGGPYSASLGQTVTFDGSKSTVPSGQTLTYAWNFGDSTSGTGVSPTHTYATAGTYTVTLTITASGGATATSTATVTISGLPVANAGGPYTANLSQAVSFDGSKSTAPSSQTLTYAWSFGDSTSGTGVSPTHTYATAGTYTVTLTITASGGATATSTATVTISGLPVANAGGPYAAGLNQTVTFDASKSTAPSGQTLTYAWNFGDGSSGTGISPTHAYPTAGTYTATLTITSTSGATATATSTVNVSATTPTVVGIAPTSGPVGTLVTVTGTNFTQGGGTPVVLISGQSGGTINAPVSTFTATSITFVVPAGAATGNIGVSVNALTVTSSSSFSVTTSSSFSVSLSPATGSVIQGQSTTFAVKVGTTNGYTGVAKLTVSGLPSGVTASFVPQSVSAGQTSILTVTAPTGQAVGTAPISVAAAALIDGQQINQTATASLQVTVVSTTFLGRTVVDDATETPIGGVTVKFMGQDASGRSTGCSGTTVSDAAGNFVLTNLPTACTGPQLISYDGLTATSPSGKFAGVNLSYTLTASKVTASPVLIHLPRIDNAEIVQVQQNASTDQVFYFHSIPGVKVTVYAGTTISLDDGSQPNPFPLVAISIALDRLPDAMPTTGMLMPFIVAFQPANAVASQPVAVNFPNSLGVAPNTHVTFVTLDPTHGYMVPYGTGTVSNDGSQFVADADPNHPGHAYGLVHFDWHGPATPPANTNNPSPDGPAPPGNGCGGGSGGGPAPPPCQVGRPVDVGSGIVTYTSTDIQIGGRRGGLTINRVYRSLSTNQGPFGLGTANQYSYALNTFPLSQGQGLLTLVMPDGNQFNFNQAPDGTFINSDIPMLRGAVITGNLTTGLFNLKWIDNSQFGFTVISRAAYLTSVTDSNGNKTALTLNSAQPLQILNITDPVGRSLTLTYDTSNHITQITDPIGRKVSYSYSAAGALVSFTDAAGGITRYTYDANNNLATIVDPRGITTEQNTYNESFDGRVTQQVLADGGILKFAYTLQNPKLATSPVLQNVVTDPLGNQTTYRFNMQGFLVSVTDASGQTRTLTRDPNHFNLVSDYTGNGVCPVCGDPTKGDIHYTFDAYGNVLTATDSLGNKTTLGYDTRFNKVNSVKDSLGHTTVIKYDSNGNKTAVTDANGNTVQAAYDSFGQPIQTTDASGAKTTIAYDAFGNVSAVTNALHNTTSFNFDAAARLTQVQDPLGRKAVKAYDSLNHVTSITDAKGNTTKVTYDAIGRLLSLKEPTGNSTTFLYDVRGRISSQTSPLGKAQTYAYDLNSNLAQFTDRRGQVSKFEYDTLNRPTKATYQDSTVAKTYDPAGRLLGITDSMDGSFNYQYDAAGRLLQQSGPTGTIAYGRDSLGRAITEQVVGQSNITYAYDAVGNLVNAAMPSVGAAYTYDARNLPLTLSRTNGVVSSYNFDAVDELVSLSHANGTSVLNSQSYTYDAGGKRALVNNSASQALATKSSVNSVDGANELIAAGATSYTYDDNGNRLTEATAGNTITYAWDSRNRLSTITDASGNKTTMHYDFARNLLGVDKSVGGVVSSQKFVVDAQTNVVFLTDSSGAGVSVLTGQSLDSHLASVNKAGNTLFGLGDALGGNTAIADGTGAIASTYSYEPYGQTTGTVPSSFPFAFAGRIAVAGNIYYNRNRYYDSGTGRFISEDPSGFGSGTNLHSYAAQDPVDLTDPTGLSTFSIGGSVSFQIGPFGSVQGSVGFAIDSEGNFGGFYFAGGGYGVGGGEHGQAGISFARSNAETICQLTGLFLNSSVGAGDGLDISGDAFTGQSNRGTVVGGGFTAGVGFGAGGSILPTYTVVLPISGPAAQSGCGCN